MANNKKKKNKILLYQYLTDNSRENYLKLFNANERLIEFILNSVFKSNEYLEENYEDLKQIGYLGLHNSIVNFDIDEIDNVSFSTFACKCIVNELLTYVAKEEKYKKNNISFSELNEITEDNRFVSFEYNYQDYNDFIDDVVEEEYQGYKKRKINEVLEKLNKRDKQIMEMYFGLNGNEPISMWRIGVYLRMGEYAVKTRIEKIVRYLKIQLKEFNGEYNPSEIKGRNILDVEKKSAPNLLELYTLEEINKGLNLLTPKEKEVMELYYGLNGGDRKDFKEIAIIMNIKDVRYRVCKYSIKLEQIIMNMREVDISGNLNEIQKLMLIYGRRNVENVFELLYEDEIKIINDYCKDSCSEDYDSVVLPIINKMKKILNNPGIYWNDRRVKEFMKMKKFIKKHSKEDVLSIINYLDNVQRDVIKLYYGLDCDDSLTKLEIATILDVSIAAVTSIVDSTFQLIEDVMNPKIKIQKKGI